MSRIGCSFRFFQYTAHFNIIADCHRCIFFHIKKQLLFLAVDICIRQCDCQCFLLRFTLADHSPCMYELIFHRCIFNICHCMIKYDKTRHEKNRQQPKQPFFFPGLSDSACYPYKKHNSCCAVKELLITGSPNNSQCICDPNPHKRSRHMSFSFIVQPNPVLLSFHSSKRHHPVLPLLTCHPPLSGHAVYHSIRSAN